MLLAPFLRTGGMGGGVGARRQAGCMGVGSGWGVSVVVVVVWGSKQSVMN